MLRADSKKNKFVYEIARKRIIPSAKIGNKLLFKESDVLEYIDRQFKLQNQ